MHPCGWSSGRGGVQKGMENIVDWGWRRLARGQVQRLWRRAQKVLASVSGEQKNILLYPTAQRSVNGQVNGILNQGTEASNRDDMNVDRVITGSEVAERKIWSS